MHCCCKRAKCQLLLWLALCLGGFGLASEQAAWALGGIGFVFGNSPEGVRRSAAPVDTTNLGDLRLLQIDVASSDRNGMVLAEDGRVFASGGNEDGELGLGTTSSNVSVLTPIDTTNPPSGHERGEQPPASRRR
jgi:hypothetical protein